MRIEKTKTYVGKVAVAGSLNLTMPNIVASITQIIPAERLVVVVMTCDSFHLMKYKSVFPYLLKDFYEALRCVVAYPPAVLSTLKRTVVSASKSAANG